MDTFDENHRTIRTRRIILSEDEMKALRIRRIFNSVGDSDFLSHTDAEEMLYNHILIGNYCLLEMAEEGNLFIISIISFEDIWSRNVFALKNFDYFNGFPDLITIYN